MKREAAYIPLHLTGGPQGSGPGQRRQPEEPVTPGGCRPMLAHVPSFGRNHSKFPDILAYPVPLACQRLGLGTWVLRCFGIARSASSPKAAQALGRRLTPGLRVTLVGVTCMARAASAPGLRTLGFLLL